MRAGALCIIEHIFTKSFNYTLSGMRKPYRKPDRLIRFSSAGNSPSDDTLRTIFYSDCLYSYIRNG